VAVVVAIATVVAVFLAAVHLVRVVVDVVGVATATAVAAAALLSASVLVRVVGAVTAGAAVVVAALLLKGSPDVRAGTGAELAPFQPTPDVDEPTREDPLLAVIESFEDFQDACGPKRGQKIHESPAGTGRREGGWMV